MGASQAAGQPRQGLDCRQRQAFDSALPRRGQTARLAGLHAVPRTSPSSSSWPASESRSDPSARGQRQRQQGQRRRVMRLCRPLSTRALRVPRGPARALLPRRHTQPSFNAVQPVHRAHCEATQPHTHTPIHPPAHPPAPRMKASLSSVRCSAARRPRPSRSARVAGSTLSLMGTARSQPTQESGRHSSCRSYLPTGGGGAGEHSRNSLLRLAANTGMRETSAATPARAARSGPQRHTAAHGRQARSGAGAAVRHGAGEGGTDGCLLPPGSGAAANSRQRGQAGWPLGGPWVAPAWPPCAR